MARAKPLTPISLERSYPCPCCRQGELQPILLTEALGCSRCQHIFALTPDSCGIKQLGTAYPYSRIWYWCGQAWMPLRAYRGLAAAWIVCTCSMLLAGLIVAGPVGWVGWFLVLFVFVMLAIGVVLVSRGF